MEMQKNDFKYYLFSGDSQVLMSSEISDKCFNMWKRIWTQSINELTGTIQKIYSDGFSRQHTIGCLFYGDCCIAMTAFRVANFGFKASKEDSLLSAWDDESFEILTSEGNNVLICSYLCVAPEFRRLNIDGISIKELTSFLSVKFFLDTACDVMTGTMRCNRGTDKAAYKVGAQFIKKSKMYGVDVDLVGFYSKHISANYSSYSNSLAEEIWSNRVDFSRTGIDSYRLKKAA